MKMYLSGLLQQNLLKSRAFDGFGSGGAAYIFPFLPAYVTSSQLLSGLNNSMDIWV